MRFRRVALVPLFLVLGPMPWLRAGSALIPKVPERPAMVAALYHGVPCPVVAMKKGMPIVAVDGGRQPADNAALTLSVGPGYAPGAVTFGDAELGCWVRPAGTGYSTFRGRITSDTARDDAFLVVFAIDQDEYQYAFDHDRPIIFVIAANEIGRLAPGKARKIEFDFGPVVKAAGHGYYWSAAVFSGGRQVHGTGITDTLPLFFDAVERFKYHRLLEARPRHGDAPFAIFRAMAIEPPPELKSKFGGQTIDVRLEIGPDGKVSGFRVDKVDDPLLTDFLRTMLMNWWLFLPPVRDGEACSQTVTLPVRL